jgi:hypothetical protein
VLCHWSSCQIVVQRSSIRTTQLSLAPQITNHGKPMPTIISSQSMTPICRKVSSSNWQSKGSSSVDASVCIILRKCLIWSHVLLLIYFFIKFTQQHFIRRYLRLCWSQSARRAPYSLQMMNWTRNKQSMLFLIKFLFFRPYKYNMNVYYVFNQGFMNMPKTVPQLHCDRTDDDLILLPRLVGHLEGNSWSQWSV